MENYEELLNKVETDLETADLSTVEAVKQFCKQHYNAGLSSVVETWEDSDIQEIIDDKSVKAVLLQLAEEELEMFADADYYAREAEDNSDEDEHSDADDEFTWDTSFQDEEEKDYGPSNPWDAPGMRKDDFI